MPSELSASAVKRTVVTKISDNYRKSNGAAYIVACGPTKILVTEAGGRALQIRHNNESLLWCNPGFLSRLPNIIEKALDPDRGWRFVLWPDVNTLGGEKTLVGPQDLYNGMVPFPILNLGNYTSRIIEGGVELTSQVDHDLQIIRRICLLNPQVFTITSEVVNYGKAIKLAPWSIFQLPMPEAVYLTGAAGRPVYYAFKPPKKDVIQELGEHSFKLLVDPRGRMREGEMHKLGYAFLPGQDLNPNALVAFVSKRTTLRVDRPVYPAEFMAGPHPDGYPGQIFWCGGKTFNKKYLELENAGPLQDVGGGDKTLPLTVTGTLGSVFDLAA